MVGYEGALHLGRPEAGQVVDVSGVRKAVLPVPLPDVKISRPSDVSSRQSVCQHVKWQLHSELKQSKG